jgi:ribonucleoside-diphosphate reductase alpha chain
MLLGLQKEIWEKKYQYKDHDKNIQDSWERTAKAIASVENKEDYQHWKDKFYNILEDFKFIPGGRILAGAGTRNNYLLNCAVLPIFDSIAGEESIARAAEKAAYMAKCNYGVGLDFSPIRPRNSELSIGGTASGVVSFMKVFDTWCSVIQDGGGRRAALIGLLRVDHPDIFDFIDAKREEEVLTQFNISVSITQDFLDAVAIDADFDLVFNDKVIKTVKAKAIWDKLIHSGYHYNDPGLLFVDEINKYNNGYYMYDIAASNPCGEIPLPPYGVCDLGNINLTKFVKEPFRENRNLDAESWRSNFDWEGYADTVKTAVRFLDNVLDVTNYPYPEVEERARGDRRIGLCGVAGLGSFLAMNRIPYDTPHARSVARDIQSFCTALAYETSVELAREKGVFPNYDAEKYLRANFIQEKLPEHIQSKIDTYGIRNLACLTIPPVGTGSLIAGNISNGLEPIFSLEYNRKVRQFYGTFTIEPVEDYAWKMWKDKVGEDTLVETPFFKTSRHIAPEDHVKMQAVLQYWIDGSISKTANIPESCTIKEYEDLLLVAIKSGVKGFTTFREGTREGVLTEKAAPEKKEEQKKEEPVKATINKTMDLEKRPRVLDGKTYKIKEPNGNIYVTLNYKEENGVKRPLEIFMYSSNESQELYAALGKTLSAVMRRTDDLDFLVEDLKSIKASTEAGGYLTPEYGFVKSRPMHVGLILEEFLSQNKQIAEQPMLKCKECGEFSVVKEGGCKKCLSCGHSECG